MRGPGAEMSAAEIESRGAQSFEAVEDLLEVLATQFGVREDTQVRELHARRCGPPHRRALPLPRLRIR